jgi:acyl-CoA synthetase (NDP forming)
MKNPVDLVWAPFNEASAIYATCLEIMIQAVDSCLTICYAFIHDEWFLSRLESIRDQTKKPIIAVPGNSMDQREGMNLAIRRGIPAYTMPENAIRAIAALTQRSEYLKSLTVTNTKS